MNDDEFIRFCQSNPDLKFERRKNGDVVFMAYADGETSNCTLEIGAEFGIWNRVARFGKFFDTSTAFRLADTSIMSPDIAGIVQSRWDELTAEQRRKIVTLCPDFIMELRSPNDRLRDCFEKMDDWMANGCRLGWIVDLTNQITYIYSPDQERQEVVGSGELHGESVLPGFSLNLLALVS